MNTRPGLAGELWQCIQLAVFNAVTNLDSIERAISSITRSVSLPSHPLTQVLYSLQSRLELHLCHQKNLCFHFIFTSCLHSIIIKFIIPVYHGLCKLYPTCISLYNKKVHFAPYGFIMYSWLYFILLQVVFYSLLLVISHFIPLQVVFYSLLLVISHFIPLQGVFYSLYIQLYLNLFLSRWYFILYSWLYLNSFLSRWYSILYFQYIPIHSSLG